MAIIGALAAAVFVAARLLLPTVVDKKAELQELIARESGYDVSIEELDGFWDGLHPGLRLRGVGINAPGENRPAVRLAELRVSLQILPLLVGRLDIHSAVLVRPSLTLERLKDGRFRISGFSPIEQVDPLPAESNEASDQAGDAGRATFAAWFFRQSRLAVEDGELQWIDWRAGERPLQLTQVNLQLRNSGTDHRLGATASFPRDVCTSCSLVADIDGNPFLGTPFDGELYLRARAIDVVRLPRIVREQLPEALRGKFSVELWSEWEASVPVSVQGDLSVADLQLPLRGLRAPLAVKQASTKIRWSGGSTDGFQAELDDLTLALHGQPWSAGRARFVRHKRETNLHVERLALDDITAFIGSLRLDAAESGAADQAQWLLAHETTRRWNALKPRGEVGNLKLRVVGAFDAPDDFTLAADVTALSLVANEGWPGMRGVSGALWATPDRGTLRLDVQSGDFALPSIFRGPLPVAHASAALSWQHVDDRWEVAANKIELRNEDIRANGDMRLRLPDDPARSPHLALKLDFRDGNGARVARYFPVHQLRPGTLAWMEHSFAGGTVTDGTLEYDGQIRDFPFAHGNGKFELRANVRDAVYRYLRGWAPVTDVSANVFIRDNHFTVTGRGRIGGLDASDIVVGSGDAGFVKVRANVTGPVAESLRVLRAVESAPGANTWRQWLTPGLQASGEGMLSLGLAVSTDGGDTSVDGEYRFASGTLRFADTPIEASNVAGEIHFDGAGVRTGEVSARFLGAPLTLAISSPSPTQTLTILKGGASAAGLAPLLGASFAAHANGSAAFEARLQLGDGRTDLSGVVDLSALRLSLPAPFNRPQGFGREPLRVHTESSAREELTLGMEMAGLMRSRLRFERRDGLRLAAGRLALGATPDRLPDTVAVPSASGMHVQLGLDELDLDRWLAILRGDGAGKSPAWLARVGVGVSRLHYLDRDFGRMDIELARDSKGWVGGISGPAADGRVRFETQGTTRISLDLSYLRLPESEQAAAGDTDPRKLPYLTLKARSFHRDQVALGELDFAASPEPQGWRVDRLALRRPESRFETSGTWRVEYGRQVCSFEARLTSQDLGATMAALDMPEQIEGAIVEVDAALAWDGTPTDLDYDSMRGNVKLNASKGRFLQIEQGAARLFGILDISAIARFLILDFSPVFGKGFAFDDIHGKVEIERGDAHTDGFSIAGPTAKLGFDGRIGLAKEDFNLTLNVYPSLTGSLTLGSFFAGGPQVALWTFIVQKLFKRQIEEGTRVTYLVKGPWRKPDIRRQVIEPTATEDVLR